MTRSIASQTTFANGYVTIGSAIARAESTNDDRAETGTIDEVVSHPRDREVVWRLAVGSVSGLHVQQSDVDRTRTA